MSGPERMWRSEIGKCPMYPDGGAFYHETMPKEPAEEYTRADLLTAAQADIARLMSALKAADAYIDEGRYEMARNVTRATIKAHTERMGAKK